MGHSILYVRKDRKEKEQLHIKEKENIRKKKKDKEKAIMHVIQ